MSHSFKHIILLTCLRRIFQSVSRNGRLDCTGVRAYQLMRSGLVEQDSIKRTPPPLPVRRPTAKSPTPTPDNASDASVKSDSPMPITLPPPPPPVAHRSDSSLIAGGQGKWTPPVPLPPRRTSFQAGSGANSNSKE